MCLCLYLTAALYNFTGDCDALCLEPPSPAAGKPANTWPSVVRSFAGSHWPDKTASCDVGRGPLWACNAAQPLLLPIPACRPSPIPSPPRCARFPGVVPNFKHANLDSTGCPESPAATVSGKGEAELAHQREAHQ